MIESISQLPSKNIGIVQSVDMKGFYVHIDIATEEGVGSLLYWANPSTDKPELGVDFGDSILPTDDDILSVINKEYDIKWLGSEEASLIYAKYFSFKEPENYEG